MQAQSRLRVAGLVLVALSVAAPGTRTAWAQAGVSLPHSAAAQYGSLPRVSLSDVQPGDIIYYGNFGPHVALYVGSGRIIHARNPGPGGGVQYDSMYGYDQPYGAVRPG